MPMVFEDILLLLVTVLLLKRPEFPHHPGVCQAHVYVSGSQNGQLLMAGFWKPRGTGRPCA